MEGKKAAKWRQKKAELVEEIEHFENKLEQLKEKIGENPKHIDRHDMEDDDKFERLRPSRKQLTDTIKMTAYRAETALVNTVRKKLSRKDDARSLIRDLCNSEADILPNIKSGILNIRVHSMANPRYNQSIEHLLIQLNENEFNYPGTSLKMHFTIAAPPNSS